MAILSPFQLIEILTGSIEPDLPVTASHYVSVAIQDRSSRALCGKDPP